MSQSATSNTHFRDESGHASSTSKPSNTHLHFGFRVEESVGELLALAQGALDDLKSRRVGEEIAHGLVQ